MINAIFLTTIKYLGHIISEKDWTPDPARSTAIKNMPSPTNVSILFWDLQIITAILFLKCTYEELH